MGIFDFKSKQSALTYPDPRLVEAVRRIDVQAAEIAHLKEEIETKRGIIKRYFNLVTRLSNENSLLLKENSRLRRELKKRTDQYNDLIDLAREKGIIGE